MFGIAAPLFFAGVFLFHASGLMKQLSIDPWKPMIVFCFLSIYGCGIRQQGSDRGSPACVACVFTTLLGYYKRVYTGLLPHFHQTILRVEFYCGQPFPSATSDSVPKFYEKYSLLLPFIKGIRQRKGCYIRRHGQHDCNCASADVY